MAKSKALMGLAVKGLNTRCKYKINVETVLPLCSKVVEASLHVLIVVVNLLLVERTFCC